MKNIKRMNAILLSIIIAFSTAACGLKQPVNVNNKPTTPVLPTQSITEIPTPKPTQTSIPAPTNAETAENMPVPTETIAPTDTAVPTAIPDDIIPAITPEASSDESPEPTQSGEAASGDASETKPNEPQEDVLPTPAEGENSAENTPTPTEGEGPDVTSEPSATEKPEPTDTETSEAIPTDSPESTDYPTATPAPTQAPTATPVTSQAPTATPIPTKAPTATPAPTKAPTTTPVTTQTPTATPIPTKTPVPTKAPTATPVPTKAPTATPTPKAPTATPVPTKAPTATPTPTKAPTATPVPTKAPTATPEPTKVPTTTPIPSPTNTPTPIFTPAPTNSPAPTSTPFPTNTPRPTATNTPIPSPTPEGWSPAVDSLRKSDERAKDAPLANTPEEASQALINQRNAGKTDFEVICSETTYAQWKENGYSACISTVTSGYSASSTSTRSSSGYKLIIISVSDNYEDLIPSETPEPTKSPATPTPYVTPTINNSKVTYTNSQVKENSYNCGNTVQNADEIFKDLVGLTYALDGRDGYYGWTYFNPDVNEVVEAAERIAGLHGITGVEISEHTRYKNGTLYYVTVHSYTSFRYTYPLETGDRSFLNNKDIETINAISALVDQAKQYATAYEKEKFFHDSITRITSYGGEVAGTGQTPYGALILNECVCNGYASTFDILLYLSGIESIFVTGIANGGGSWGEHAWNMVKLDGEWYNVDVTWDDPDSSDPDYVSYTYFNVPDSEFLPSHSPSVSGLPKCTSDKYKGNRLGY